MPIPQIDEGFAYYADILSRMELPVIGAGGRGAALLARVKSAGGKVKSSKGGTWVRENPEEAQALAEKGVGIAKLLHGRRQRRKKGRGPAKTIPAQMALMKQEYRKAMKQVRQYKAKSLKRRYYRKALNYRQQYIELKLRQKLISEGVVHWGAQTEVIRNVFAAEYHDPKTKKFKKKALARLIRKYDQRIAKAVARYNARAKAAGKRPLGSSNFASGLGVSSLKLERAVREMYRKNSLIPKLRIPNVATALVDGTGGLAFDAVSPPGAGRLCRLPMYPADVAQAWSGANGIIEPGDDPVLSLGPWSYIQTQVGPFRMTSPRLDYGTFRLLGIQVEWGRNLRVEGGASGVGSALFGLNGATTMFPTLRNMQVYNGNEVLVVDENQEMAGETFKIFRSMARGNHPSAGIVYPAPLTLTIQGFPPQEMFIQPYNRRARYFVGFRDQPIVQTNSNVTMDVFGYVTASVQTLTVLPGAVGGTPPTAAGNYPAIPFVAWLIVDILEDKVYGDPANPSPPSRAGANIKLALTDKGRKEGKDVKELVSSRYLPTSVSGDAHHE